MTFTEQNQAVTEERTNTPYRPVAPLAVLARRGFARHCNGGTRSRRLRLPSFRPLRRAGTAGGVKVASALRVLAVVRSYPAPCCQRASSYDSCSTATLCRVSGNGRVIV